ncbi:MAG: peptide chain release factor N(5)-glutamine methyltransferase, partial [Planctomycetaceae bacterium]|nr:peptide chain release factor N(5)-glutamine methyltransferase [Planctomycetaceae bacterium]
MSTETWTVQRILDSTTDYLRTHGSESPRLEAEILLAHSRGCRRIELYTRYAEELTDTERTTMRELVRRRAKAEPVAYLVGHREFYALDFQVTTDVLVPRPETETLVLGLLDRADRKQPGRVLDLGTGSGCIAVTVAVNWPLAAVTAVDLSPAAAEVARRNAKQHKVEDRLEVLVGDLYEPLPAQSRFDFIASNPPYIRTDEMAGLPADVAGYEPHLALEGGTDGMD